MASELSLQVGDRELAEGTACAKTGPSGAGSAGPGAIPVVKSQMRDGRGLREEMIREWEVLTMEDL